LDFKENIVTSQQAYDIEDFLRRRGYVSGLLIDAVKTYYDVIEAYFEEYGTLWTDKINELEEKIEELEEDVAQQKRTILELEQESIDSLKGAKCGQ